MVALERVQLLRWMRRIRSEGNGQWLWPEMTLILMQKIVRVSLRLFFDGDVDICLLLFKYLPQAEGGAVASCGR
jgi:hypothetical protein